MRCPIARLKVQATARVNGYTEPIETAHGRVPFDSPTIAGIDPKPDIEVQEISFSDFVMAPMLREPADVPVPRGDIDSQSGTALREGPVNLIYMRDGTSTDRETAITSFTPASILGTIST